MMERTAGEIIQVRSGGAVERCHCVRHFGSYSNAMHQWGATMLLFKLFPSDFPRLGPVLLTHDVPEAWFGDVPATTMRFMPGLKEALGEKEAALNRSLGNWPEQDLTEEDLAKVKACDRLDLYLWCQEQLLLGNRFVEEFLSEIRRWMKTIKMPQPAQALYEFWEQSDPSVFLPRQAGVVEEACKA